MPFQISRKWSIGDVTIGVLGLNLWITFLVLPTLHFLQHSPGVATVAGIIAGPLLLAAGLHLHHRHLLLFGLPLSLFVPALFNPKLVGVNVYSAWSFALVATSFLAYMLATLAILRGHELPPVPEERRSIGEYVLSPRWRRRFRIYRWMAALSVLFPAVLIFGIFLDPEIQTLVRQSFPGRAQEAVTFFGIGALALWLLLFHADFLTPLRSHVRGDPYLHSELRRLRRAAFRARPGLSFYIAVVLALALILVFFLTL